MSRFLYIFLCVMSIFLSCNRKLNNSFPKPFTVSILQKPTIIKMPDTIILQTSGYTDILGRLVVDSYWFVSSTDTFFFYKNNRYYLNKNISIGISGQMDTLIYYGTKSYQFNQSITFNVISINTGQTIPVTLPLPITNSFNIQQSIQTNSPFIGTTDTISLAVSPIINLPTPAFTIIVLRDSLTFSNITYGPNQSFSFPFPAQQLLSYTPRNTNGADTLQYLIINTGYQDTANIIYSLNVVPTFTAKATPSQIAVQKFVNDTINLAIQNQPNFTTNNFVIVSADTLFSTITNKKYNPGDTLNFGPANTLNSFYYRSTIPNLTPPYNDTINIWILSDPTMLQIQNKNGNALPLIIPIQVTGFLDAIDPKITLFTQQLTLYKDC